MLSMNSLKILKYKVYICFFKKIIEFLTKVDSLVLHYFEKYYFRYAEINWELDKGGVLWDV